MSVGGGGGAGDEPADHSRPLIHGGDVCPPRNKTDQERRALAAGRGNNSGDRDRSGGGGLIQAGSSIKPKLPSDDNVHAVFES